MALTEDDKLELLEKYYDLIKESPYLIELQYKTQVLNSAITYPELKLTTRYDHSVQVSNNAAEIAKGAGASRSEVMKARIAGLSHDLGHTPMGHPGETAFNEYAKGYGESYNHAYAGEVIFRKISDEFINSQREQFIDINDPKIDEKLSYLQEAREDMALAVRNHSVYYIDDLSQPESVVQGSVRVADSVAMMPSDLYDSFHAEDAEHPGQKIITIEELEKFIENLAKAPNEGMESLDIKGICEELMPKGVNDNRTANEAVSKLQKRITDEIARITTPGKQLMGIPDSIKALSSSIANVDQTTEKGKKSFAYSLLKYDTIMEKSGAKYMPMRDGIRDKLKLMQDDASISLSPAENKEVKKYIWGEMNRIRVEFGQKCPTLLGVYLAHDKMQYEDKILSERTSVFGNKETEYKEFFKKLFKHFGDDYETLSNLDKKILDEKSLPFTGDKKLNYIFTRTMSLGNDKMDKLYTKFGKDLEKVKVKFLELMAKKVGRDRTPIGDAVKKMTNTMER